MKVGRNLTGTTWLGVDYPSEKSIFLSERNPICWWLVSVSFSLNLVKMKVVTRLEMVVSTVTTVFILLCLLSSNHLQLVRLLFPSAGGTVASSSHWIAFISRWLIDHARKRLPKDCSVPPTSILQNLLNYLKIFWPLLPSCVWENPLENLPTLTN